LNDSKYNERRSECEEALSRLQTVTNIDSLGDLSNEEFESYKDVIKDETLIRRARHAVYENQRTIEAMKALKANDIKRFGILMNKSHESLRDDYEVTGIELDTLVSLAWNQEGVVGARMTGAGFGGCTVNIVNDDSVNKFVIDVGEAYEEKIGYKAEFYVVEIGGGPKKL
ncbi:MAG: galactokinase, partial [Clostridiales bacterium]|nr:galactokinase [Clostridiales bacterium]